MGLDDFKTNAPEEESGLDYEELGRNTPPGDADSWSEHEPPREKNRVDSEILKDDPDIDYKDGVRLYDERGRWLKFALIINKEDKE